MTDVPRPGSGLNPADALAIHDLLARYGFLIDERAFIRLDEVFTDDVTYDAADFGVPVLHGLDAVIAYLGGETRHPLAHHSSNVLLDPCDESITAIMSKGIGVLRDGRVGSVTYQDVAVKTAAGWRLASRRAVLRR